MSINYISLASFYISFSKEGYYHILKFVEYHLKW